MYKLATDEGSRVSNSQLDANHFNMYKLATYEGSRVSNSQLNSLDGVVGL